MKNYLPNIRDQYELYPFPARKPEDEAQRLIVSEIDHLAKIDHHCFGGRRDFDKPFRVLVAGGGTGDALLFLFEQLRGKPAEFVFLDMSTASLAIAKSRAEARGLTNVQWIHDSLLNLDQLDLGKFDYINCVGVLHHLDDPSAGLAQLESVLAIDGGMGLMLYGKYGRSNVYLVQELLGLLHNDGMDLPSRVDSARRTLSELLRTGAIQGNEATLQLIENPEATAYLVDTYLHGQDRAFSCSDIFELLGENGLELAGFTNFFEEQGVTCALEYDPHLFFGDPKQISHLETIGVAQRAHVAELIGKSTSMHAFYVSRRFAAAAAPADGEHVPRFATGYGQSAIRGLLDAGAETIALNFNCGVSRTLAMTKVARFVFECIGEGVCIDAICRQASELQPETPAEQTTGQVYAMLDLLMRLGLIVLRHRDLEAIAPYPSQRPWTGAIDLRPFAALSV